jgi:hypothetical protein
MTDISMAEIAPGVWVPRSVVDLTMRTGLRRENAEAGTRYDEAPPLEPVSVADTTLRVATRTMGDTTELNDVPDTTQPQRQTVFNCVKRYRFIKHYDKLSIEVELMSGTTLRHIIKLSQVKGILTRGHTAPYAEGQRPVKEVIIDLRAITFPGYAPEQLKFKFAGDENALAFQMALMDAL